MIDTLGMIKEKYTDSQNSLKVKYITFKHASNQN